MSHFFKESLFAAGAVGLSLLFITQSRKLTDSAAMLPMLLAWIIILLAGLMLLEAWREHRRALLSGKKPVVSPVNVPRVTIYLGMIVLYVVLVEPLGYFIATPVYIVVSYMFLRALGLLWSLAVALGFSALVYGLFVTILHLPVPLGLLEKLMEG